MAAMLAVAAAGVVLYLGQSQRADEIRHEGRALCRVAARTAAESAVARARGRLATGRSATRITGSHGDDVRYVATVRSAGSSATVVAEGRCEQEGRPAIAHIEARLKRRGRSWQIVAWRDDPR